MLALERMARFSLGVGRLSHRTREVFMASRMDGLSTLQRTSRSSGNASTAAVSVGQVGLKKSQPCRCANCEGTSPSRDMVSCFTGVHSRVNGARRLCPPPDQDRDLAVLTFC